VSSVLVGYCVVGTKMGIDIQLLLSSKYCCFNRHVQRIAESDCWLRHVCPSAHLSAWNSSAATERCSWKSIFVYFSNICWENSVFFKI